MYAIYVQVLKLLIFSYVMTIEGKSMKNNVFFILYTYKYIKTS